MANPVKGEAPLILKDGRQLTLVLDMEALVDAETAFGQPLPKLMAQANQGFMGATAALLQGALQRHNPLTRSEALEIIRTDPDAVSAALEKAIDAAFPKASTEGNAEVAPAKPRGKSSGRSGAKRS